MKQIIRSIKKHHLRQFCIYGIVGVCALVLQMLIYIGLCKTRMHPLIATIISSFVGMIVAYKGHVKFTFEKEHQFNKKEFIKYTITSILGMLFNLVSVYFLVTIKKCHPDIGIIPMMLTPAVTFIINKFWAFKH